MSKKTKTKPKKDGAKQFAYFCLTIIGITLSFVGAITLLAIFRGYF